MTLIEAAKLALEALTRKKWFRIGLGEPNDPKVEAAIAALSAAIEAAEKQEPVAWMHNSGHIQGRNPNWDQVMASGYTREKGWSPLYTTPPAAQPAPVHDQLAWQNLRNRIQADIDRTDGRWGLHGHSAVDNDYFTALEWVVERMDEILSATHRQPLTEAEIADVWDKQFFDITDMSLAIDFVRDIEAAHGITRRTEMTKQTDAMRLADKLEDVALNAYVIEPAAAELRRLDAEIERKSNAIQRLWKERDDLRAGNAQLLKALTKCISLLRLIGQGDSLVVEAGEAAIKATKEQS
jgi:hypothetical protein